MSSSEKSFKKMKAGLETRAYKRFKYKASIVCGYHNKSNYRASEILNFGENGMYFESHFAFHAGAIICVKRENYSADTPCSEECRPPPMVFLAEVRWCRERFETGSSRYGIGAKYLEPIY